MAEAINNYLEEYKDSVEDTRTILGKIDLDTPQDNVIEADTATMTLLKIQAETQAEAIGETLNFIKNNLPHLTANLDGHTPLSVAEQNLQLDTIGKKNFLATRMLQQRQQENQRKLEGEDFDAKREPICEIPPSIATNNTDHVSDTALKLLPVFHGDTDSEADNLKQFLRQVFDVAQTNKLNEKCVINIIRRRLSGTATKLIDIYVKEQATTPTLRQCVLKLEELFMTSWTPEIANAKLSLYKKKPSQTYQALQGEIAELVDLASRGEEPDTRQTWIKSRRVGVFKQAVSEDDRQLISRENQSRAKTGLNEMNLSQMTHFLIKIYSEQEAFSTVSHLKTSRKYDEETVQVINTKSKTQVRKDKRQQKKADVEAQTKEALYAFHQQTGQGFTFPNKGYGGARNNQNKNGYGGNTSYNKNGNSSFNKNGNGRFKGRFEKNNPNFNQKGGNRNNSNNKNTTKPRKFVTPSMVGVNQNSCLKCNSPTHRFQEESKCVYGTGNLMTRPCFNCQEGGHHQNICIKNKKPTLGAQDPGNQEPLDQQFSKWPEATKQVPEFKPQNIPQENSKNSNWLPYLFPN